MKKINLTDYIQKTGTSVSLSSSEREKLLRVTREYMSMKPVRTVRIAPVRVWSFHSFSTSFRKPMAIALIAVLLIASGGTVSYAAEGALPGDLLYQVKVSINEEVRALAVSSNEGRALVEAERAEKRLAEASALAAEGRLTKKAEAELVARFEKHAAKASAHVEVLDAEDVPAAIEVASDFESKLAAHIEILDEVRAGEGAGIRARALAKAHEVSNIRISAENTVAISGSGEAADAAPLPPTAFAVSLKSAPQESDTAVRNEASDEDTDGVRKNVAARMGKSAKNALAEIEKLFDRAEARFTAEEKVRLETAITQAKEDIRVGDIAYEEAAFGRAFHAYQEAFVSLKKISVFLKTSLKGKIRVRIDTSSAPRQSLSSEAVPSVPAERNLQPESETRTTDAERPSGDVLRSPLKILPEPFDPPVDIDAEISNEFGGRVTPIDNGTRLKRGD